MVGGVLARVAVLSAASLLLGATVTPAPAPAQPQGPQREQVVQFGRYDYTVDTTHSLLTQATTGRSRCCNAAMPARSPRCATRDDQTADDVPVLRGPDGHPTE